MRKRKESVESITKGELGMENKEKNEAKVLGVVELQSLENFEQCNVTSGTSFGPVCEIMVM